MPMNFKRPMNFPAQGFNPQNPNQKLPPIFYYNLDDPKVEKRWRNPKEDLTDYFNYGHNETTWKLYAEKVVKLTNKMDNFMHKDSSCNVLNDKLPLDLGGFGPPHFEPIQKLPFFEIIKKNKERFFFQQLADRNEFKNQLQNSLTGDFVEENYSDVRACYDSVEPNLLQMKHPLPQQATHTPMYGHGYPPYSAYHNNQNRMGPPQDTSNLANSSMFRGGNRPFPGDREKGPIQGREERKTDIRERDRERERERDRERDRERERERERERDRERERERERDREKERSRKKRGRSRSGSFSPRKATPTSRDREERGRRDRDSKKKDRKDRDHDRKRRRSSLSSEDKRDRRDREDRKKRKDRERSRDGRHGGREDKDRDRGDYSGNKTKKESASNIHMRIQTRK